MVHVYVDVYVRTYHWYSSTISIQYHDNTMVIHPVLYVCLQHLCTIIYHGTIAIPVVWPQLRWYSYGHS